MTLNNLEDKIAHLENLFREQNSHLPEALLLGRMEYQVLISGIYAGGFHSFSHNIASICRYKQFDVYEVNVDSLIKIY